MAPPKPEVKVEVDNRGMLHTYLDNMGAEQDGEDTTTVIAGDFLSRLLNISMWVFKYIS